MIRIALPFPPSVNAAYANGGNKRGRHKTAAYLAWEGLASINVKDSHRRGFGSYSLHIALKRPDKRRRDLGNFLKCLEDFLVAHGIVKDDSYAERIEMVWDNTMPDECVVIVQAFEPGLAR